VKSRRKLLSILLTLSLLVTLLVPMVGPASASSTYTMSNVRVVKAGSNVNIGALQIDLPAVTTTSSYVYMSLPASPTGYEFKDLEVYVPNSVGGTDNAVTDADIDSNGRVVRISIAGDGSGNPGRIIVRSANDGSSTYIGGIRLDIPSGVTGEVTATMSAPSSQIFSGGSVVLCKVGTGTVTLAAENVPNISSSGGSIGIIDVKEGVAGALASGNNSVKLTLPNGFTWSSYDIGTLYWGSEDGLDFDLDDSDRTLKITVDSSRNVPGTFFTIAASVEVDESVAKTGDVKVTISGDSSISPSEIIVARYGEFGVTASVVTKENILAGKSDVKIGKFSIKESIAGSLSENRTITLTLPEGAKWTNFPTIDADLSKNQDAITLSTWSGVGTDFRMIKVTVEDNAGINNSSNDPAELVFKDAKVVTEPGFSGDLKVTLGGSQGLTGDLVLAAVQPAVSANVDQVFDVKIGLPDQNIGTLTIAEAAAGAIDSEKHWTYQANGSDKYLSSDSDNTRARIVIETPTGVRFSSLPKVEVANGDVVLDTSGIELDADDTQLIIPVKSASTTASAIKISGVSLTVDRTVPEGDLKLKIKGSAVNESLNEDGDDEWFVGSEVAAKVVVAKCVTPAPVTTKVTAVFKIGDPKFSLNGVEQTMDVAPYLKNDRTYLPLRFVAKAVGVPDSNIIWNGSEQSVVLIKEGSVVKLTIGSNIMTINGTPITMDVAPEIVDPGRTMLPIRWVGQALGCTINWDNATQTVTVN